MLQPNVLVPAFLVHSAYNFAPQLRCLQNIGLVYRSHFSPSLARCLERHMGNALDLRGCVDFGIDASLAAVCKSSDALRLAKINAPSEFPHHQHIGSLHDFPLEG